MSFGEKLRAIRRKNKLSLESVANEVGVSKSAIWQWENEMTDPDNIRSTNMDALCQLFNIQKSYFTGTLSKEINENRGEYSIKPEWDDMLSKTLKYVLENAPELSHDDFIIASRLLYNQVKNKSVILKTDLNTILKMLN